MHRATIAYIVDGTVANLTAEAPWISAQLMAGGTAVVTLYSDATKQQVTRVLHFLEVAMIDVVRDLD